jgi:hypothetical protein
VPPEGIVDLQGMDLYAFDAGKPRKQMWIDRSL